MPPGAAPDARTGALRLVERAPAKVNLMLHVLGRRPDGYHELESLVAFAGAGDTLSLAPGEALSLAVEGPTAGAAGPESDNLVLKAARALAERVSPLELGAFRLVKRLPVAAGLGGGSSDAAAALRLLGRLNGLPAAHAALVEAARATGADVPVCLDPRARVMRGIGDVLGPPLDLPPLYCVLVNPGVPVATAAVFGALNAGPFLQPNAASEPSLMGRQELLAALARARNDLEAPALKLAPAIGEALGALRASAGCRLTRMSGSGATVFGLYGDCRAAAAARRGILATRPRWWVKATVLR
jgi:4-diphosphocytidyl-2-C-methyl-D-erythritol kinase